MLSPNSTILVVDHSSEDSTLEIARRFHAKIENEELGLGFARQLCLELVDSDYVVFTDSDVEILDKFFLQRAKIAFESKGVGAVVGLSVGHRFAYGLPASLLVIKRSDFLGNVIPAYIDARETFFLQKRLDELNLKTTYVYDAMKHRSHYRRFKPEWEGANSRILPSSPLRELLFSAKVILLLTLNSKSLKNVLYLPVFYLKYFRGFVKPGPWLRLERHLGGTSNETH